MTLPGTPCLHSPADDVAAEDPEWSPESFPPAMPTKWSRSSTKTTVRSSSAMSPAC